MRAFLLLIACICLLAGCGHSNSVRIGGEQEGYAVRLDDNSLYINPSLAGLEPGEEINIDTSSNNNMSFRISQRRPQAAQEERGSAF